MVLGARVFESPAFSAVASVLLWWVVVWSSVDVVRV